MNHKGYQRAKAQLENTMQVLEPDSEVSRILGLSEQEFKTTVLNWLKMLMNEVECMQEQRGMLTSEVHNLRKC